MITIYNKSTFYRNNDLFLWINKSFSAVNTDSLTVTALPWHKKDERLNKINVKNRILNVKLCLFFSLGVSFKQKWFAAFQTDAVIVMRENIVIFEVLLPKPV